MARGRTRVTSKNQVTIPVDALRKAGIAADDVVSVYADGEGRIVVERMESLIERYAEMLSGTWPGGVEGFLAERKRAWE
jgi:bifunctional DNA-binding transcriptional regulator/antitoxin component of YhaV-PrlF toxin-antitoxin module